MKPKIIEQGANVVPKVQCAKCGQRLHFKEWNEKSIPYINTKVIIENYCPNCGEIVDGYKEDK